MNRKIIGVTVGTPINPKRIAREIVPEVTTNDEGKVLTAEDGKAVWKKPVGGGAEVVVLDSIENAPDDIADGTLIVIPTE